MLHISLQENSIEFIQTKKNLLGGLKIITSGKKTYAGKFIHEDLRKSFDESYPKPVTDKQVSLILPTDSSTLFRFTLKRVMREELLGTYIFGEAKNRSHLPLENYENFYKIFRTTSESLDILFTAMPIATVIFYRDLFKNAGFELKILSTSAFSLFECIKPITSSSLYFVMHVANGKREYILFDTQGPVRMISTANEKSLKDDIKIAIRLVQEEQQGEIQKIYVSGEDAIELNIKELEESLHLNIVKISDALSPYLTSRGIVFESGGIPQMYFTNVLGSIFLTQNKFPVNFAIDSSVLHVPISSQSQPLLFHQSTKENDKEKANANVSLVDLSSKQDDTVKKTNSFFLHKLFRIYILLGISIVVTLTYVLFFRRGNMTNLMSTLPTPSPSQIPVPTNSPTPTIDAKLKRSDITIMVQNGTDISGYAKERAKLFEEKGYKHVSFGNADVDTYENSVIKVKKNAAKYISLIIVDFPDAYNRQQVESLDDLDKYDILVILGRK